MSSAVVVCSLCSQTCSSRTQLFRHLTAAHGYERSPAAPEKKKALEPTSPLNPPLKRQQRHDLPFIVCPSGYWYQPGRRIEPPRKGGAQAPASPSGERAHAIFQPSRPGTGRDSVSRTTLCADSCAWLNSHDGTLPRRYHVITSLPDIGELKPRPTPAAYEEWFSGTVQLLLEKLHPSAVAIFYQTDAREAGVDGSWLDKSFLCTLGARAAGALCVWHHIVSAARPGQLRETRPGFVHLLCFSKQHRCTFSALDVLPTRGYMHYAAAMGEAPASAAVQYVRLAHAAAANASPHDDGRGDDGGTGTGSGGGSASTCPLVLDPFCGSGSVLALSNAWGLDAMGIDTNQRRCRVALARQAKREEDVYDHNGVQLGPIEYWRGTC